METSLTDFIKGKFPQADGPSLVILENFLRNLPAQQEDVRSLLNASDEFVQWINQLLTKNQAQKTLMENTNQQVATAAGAAPAQNATAPQANKSPFAQKAIEQLEKMGISANYYNKAMEGIALESDADVTNFVVEVQKSWNALLQEFANNAFKEGLRPAAAQKAQGSISSAVQSYIDARSKKAEGIGKLSKQPQ